MIKAVYAGSFDPGTLGHLNIIERASKVFKHLVVAVGYNSAKKELFSPDKRMNLLERSINLRGLRNDQNLIQVMTFSEMLLVSFCRQIGATVIVRGLRAAVDFEFELFMAQANTSQDSGIETVFLPTDPKYSFVSSSAVKEIARLGGKVSDYVDEIVAEALREKFGVK